MGHEYHLKKKSYEYYYFEGWIMGLDNQNSYNG